MTSHVLRAQTIAALEALDTALMDSSLATEARATTIVAEVQQVRLHLTPEG